MNIEVIWPDAPVFRREYCWECSRPVKASTRGRPRQYCSAACRQRRYRDKTNFRSKDYQYRKEDRAVERQLRQYERAKGKRIDSVTPISPGTRIDRRHYLIFGLRDGRHIEYCLWCGVPILREKHRKRYRRRCCSRLCSSKFGVFVRQTNSALQKFGDNIDPEVRRRLRVYNLNSKDILPPIRSQVWLCDHCGKPFAATHLARKYCSRKCRQNAWYAAHKTCAFCKRRYRPAYNKAGIQMYCSRLCKNRARKPKPPLAIRRICPGCGESFLVNRKNHTIKICCSRRCYNRVYWRHYRNRRRG